MTITTRAVFNSLGEKVGELTLPDNATEQEWADKLAEYAKPPPALDLPDVTARQMRQALILSNISTASIEAALNSLPEPNKSLAIAEWEYSNMFQRHRPLVAAVGAMLGFSDAQIDAVWQLAASL